LTFSINPGVIDEVVPPAPPPPAYVAKAVHFDGTTSLTNAALVCSDSSLLSFAGWFKTTWAVGSGGSATVFVGWPAGNFAPWLGAYSGPTYLQLGSNDGTNSCGSIEDIPANGGSLNNTNVWQHIIGTMNTNHPSGAKKFVWYFDNNKGELGFTPNPNTGAAFTITMNGKPWYIGDDSSGFDQYTGDMCDLSIWTGVSFFNGTETDIPLATRQLFMDGSNKPVDPAVAIAALGSPAVMLSGNHTTFAANSLGGGGAFSTLTGALTDAATHP